MENRLKILATSQYGRCVYRCDNDVADHQTVSALFAGGIAATFTMSAFTSETHRNIKLYGTDGEITGDLEQGVIELKQFSSGERTAITVCATKEGHAGGDVIFCRDFVRMVRENDTAGKTSVGASLQSHYMAFAAEQSRREDGHCISFQIPVT